MGRDLWITLIAGLLMNLISQTNGESSSGSSSSSWNIINQRNGNKNVGSSTLQKYCESWRINVELNNIREFKVVPEECTNYVGKYMTSTQYKSDSERTIEEAEVYLARYCPLEGDGKDVWIFDVDETLLSTVPYFKKHGFGGEKMNHTSLEGWMKERKAVVLEHTLRIFNEVRLKGVKIFIISNRRECLRDATVENLLKVGYQGWSGLILRGGVEDEKVESYKAGVRRRLVDEQGYRILGIISDQWSSFDNGYPSSSSAKSNYRSFKLPNSIYYVA
ncbi:acid phosphatase 1-like [Impatiens glandulifera]|uniref:acid phosphatase 1-like n=1 Tax=Impatiens glandulifera TaxID=253017 RepID=UPI001FB1A1AF|nr:acid phosphatase 1-like [Impatiens glandulifera]